MNIVRKLLIWLFFVFASQSVFGNAIDSLKTNEDVLVFFRSIDEKMRDDLFRKLEIRSTDSIIKHYNCDGIFEKWKAANWEKTDFNRDGNTDIIAILYWSPRSQYSISEYEIYIAIDKGNNTFKLTRLTRGNFSNCEVAKPSTIGNDQVLLYYHKKDWQGNTNNYGDTYSAKQTDTLIFKDDGFIEWNTRPAHYEVRSIIFKTYGCFGSCPVFEMKINDNGKATFNAIAYNKQKGRFTTIIKKENLSEIISLINYIDLKKLKDQYTVSWTDDAGCNLIVKFNDGSVKKIYDYGMIGSFGLSRLYELFEQLRENQDWK